MSEDQSVGFKLAPKQTKKAGDDSEGGMFDENQDDEDAEQKEKDLEWEEYRDHPQPVQIPQSFVYELILKNVYKE